MKRLFILLLIFIMQGLTSQNKGPKNAESIMSFNYLPWMTRGTYVLPDSNSIISVPKNYFLLIGKDAKQALSVMKMGLENNCEALMRTFFNKEAYNILFYYYDGIHVYLKGLSSHDCKKLLEINKDNFEDPYQTDHGSLTLLKELRERPKLDLASRSLYFSFNIINDSGRFVFVNFYKFGRKGFERISWIQSEKSFESQGLGLVNILRNCYQFNPGYRHGDYSLDDDVITCNLSDCLLGKVCLDNKMNDKTARAKLIVVGFLFFFILTLAIVPTLLKRNVTGNKRLASDLLFCFVLAYPIAFTIDGRVMGALVLFFFFIFFFGSWKLNYVNVQPARIVIHLFCWSIFISLFAMIFGGIYYFIFILNEPLEKRFLGFFGLYLLWVVFIVWKYKRLMWPKEPSDKDNKLSTVSSAG